MLRVVSLIQLRLVGWRNCLVADLLPVDLLEPGVRLDLLSVGWSRTEPLVRVLVEESDAEIARILRQEVEVELRLSILDVLVQLFTVLRVEGWKTDQHLVDDRSKRPPVRRLAMTLSLQHLRGQVLGCSTKRLGLAVASDSHLGETKIGQLDVACTVYKHVLWFQTRHKEMG